MVLWKAHVYHHKRRQVWLKKAGGVADSQSFYTMSPGPFIQIFRMVGNRITKCCLFLWKRSAPCKITNKESNWHTYSHLCFPPASPESFSENHQWRRIASHTSAVDFRYLNPRNWISIHPKFHSHIWVSWYSRYISIASGVLSHQQENWKSNFSGTHDPLRIEHDWTGFSWDVHGVF